MSTPKHTPGPLAEIGERIRTQDNRMTMNPMFCVQEKKRVVGMDANYATETVWIDMESGNADEVAPETPGAEEFGFFEYWETVAVAFTEEGCKEYLRLNGHNHCRETRIYVESFNCCPEMIAIREALMKDGNVIDAAQDLLEACRLAAHAIDVMMGDSDFLGDESCEMKASQALHAAIAKAKADGRV